MIDKNLIKKHPEEVTSGLENKKFRLDLEKFNSLDSHRKTVQSNLQQLQNTRNTTSKEIGLKKSKNEDTNDLFIKVEKINKEIESLTSENTNLLKQIHDFLSIVPNIPLDKTPVGNSEDDNVEIGFYNLKPNFDFIPKNHYEIEASNKYLMLKDAAKISGSRYMALKDKYARLHRALGQFMIDMQVDKNGYEEYYLPVIVNEKSLYNTGQLPKFENDLFKVGKHSYLIPTAEVPLTNLLSSQKYKKTDLPLKLASITNCFRSEAGAYGKDTAGILRQHQFEKTELVWITTPENSENDHLKLLEDAKSILNALKLHYKVVDLCTGDLGFSAARTYDIEVWLPGQNTYREISSCSNCTDFQSRRMNFKYADDEGKAALVHTLNGSGLAVGRTLIAVLENYQQKDGSIKVPDCLKKYMGDIDVIR